MKAILNISLLALLALSSCTSSLYTGAEYDDLYFSASDKPVVKARPSVREQVSDQNQNAGEYYDNIYAADTLVADEYAEAVDIDDQIVENNIYDNGYDYYDNYSYTGRLSRFYGNYFNPYWRDPFYFDYGYGFPSYSLGMGYNGYPWSYNYYSPFYYDPYNYYDPFYNYGRYYGSGYYGSGYYGGFYGGLYRGFYGGYYGGYSGYGGGYYARESRDYVPYGRTERASNLSSRWNSNTGATGSGRRDSYLSTGSSSGTVRRVASDSRTIASGTGRAASPNTIAKPSYGQADRKAVQTQTGTESLRSNSINNQRNAASTRPSYSDVNRSYTPSYNSPRMPTRPAYNNSRVSENVNSGTTNRSNSAVTNSRVNSAVPNNRVNSNSGSSRSNVNQGTYQNFNNSGSNSSGSGTQRRVDAPTGYSSPSTGSRSNVSTYRNTESYSVPSRSSSVPSRSSYSSGSYNNSSSGSRSSSYSGSSNYSSGSSSSYSSGSSYSGGSSSGSSGSSSGSSSSSGGSSGSGSGRR